MHVIPDLKKLEAKIFGECLLTKDMRIGMENFMKTGRGSMRHSSMNKVPGTRCILLIRVVRRLFVLKK
jgi:hypothetical protein